jgi:hypothetical protein
MPKDCGSGAIFSLTRCDGFDLGDGEEIPTLRPIEIAMDCMLHIGDTHV